VALQKVQGFVCVGTLGPVIFEAPILLEDFLWPHWPQYPDIFASTQEGLGSAAPLNLYDTNLNNIVLADPSSLQLKDLYPLRFERRENPYNLFGRRFISADGTKARDEGFLSVAKALARAGYVGTAGDDNFYFEIKMDWQMDERFPWDNTTGWSFYNQIDHDGNGIWPNFTKEQTINGACGKSETTHLTVVKDITVSDPKHIYSADCGLRACNALKYNSQQGDYFQVGEVRVPFKLQKVEINLPTEFKINSAVALDYHQGGSVQTSTAITASATTGAITFTNSGGGDFPRIDDQAGNQIAWKMCYDLVKQGTAAPSAYKVPVKYTLTDEFGNTVIRLDTMFINEANPELVLTPLTPTLNNTDGGACAPAYFDFQIQNNTLYAAPNVYFAAQSSAGTVMVDVTDGGNTYTDPIVAADKSVYGGTNIFVKLGTMNAGDIRIVRVFANTNVCADNFDVYADFGCAYPSPLQAVTGSPTIDKTTASYVALAPTIASKPVSDVTVNDLCANKTIEIEVKNTRNTNITKMLAAFKLPANATYVAGTAQMKFPTTGAYAAVNAAGINSFSADSLILTLNSNNPFNTPCGLAGADTATLNTFLLKFDIAFNACPATNVGSVLGNIEGENYCGTKATSRVTVPLYYLGSGGTQNNYTVAGTGTPITICAGIGKPQPIIDTIKITNIGGFGASSGVSSGKDSITVTIPVDPTHFLLTNFAVGAPFSSPTMGTDAFGNTTLRVLIPAGQAIGATAILPLTYDLTPTTANICQPSTTVLCNYSKITSPVLLECAAKSLTCGTISSAIRGTGSNVHTLECCYVNLVLTKTVDSSSVSVKGRSVTFTVKVKNTGANTATDVTVKVTSTIGFTFVSATPSVSYDNVTGIWTVGTINAGAEVTLSITMTADSAGVNYCTAEVMTTDQPDINSTPGNSVAGEDDMARVCVTVPVELCPGQTFTATLPSGSTGIKWYKDNVEIVGQTGTSLVITALGSYKYETNESSCPVAGCCPINVIAGPCACDTTLVLADKTICKGATVDLFAQASGVKGTLTYSTNGTTWAALTSPTNVTPSVTTIYYIKDSLTVWCKDIDTLTITVDDLPVVNAGTAQSICAGSPVTLAGTKSGGATSTTWTGTGTFSSASSLTSTYTPSGASGTETLTLTSNAVGVCPAATSTVVITINPVAIANAGTPKSVCSGSAVALTGSIGGSASSSTWTGGTGTFSNAASPTSTYTPSITSGTETLTLTTNTPTGCPAAVSTVVVTVNGTPDFTLTKPVACPGTGEDVVVTGLTNSVVATTEFKINAGAFRQYPNTGIITGLTAGNYTITIKNAEGCQATKSVTVNSVKPIICVPVTVTRAK
jgi:uncharacterized repeat protein (TIGR01451 family)